MTTYDVESLFTNIPLNEAINIMALMLSHYSPTTLLMMLLIFVYRHMIWSQYSPTSLLMKLLIFVYDDI